MRRRIGTEVVRLWIVGSILWLGGDTMVAGALSGPGAKPESVLPRTNVMVTATVVQLTKAVYRDLGGRLLGHGDLDEVVEKMTEHVQDHPDAVIAGAQVHTANHETNECGDTQQVYYPRRDVRKSMAFDAHECGKLFSASVGVLDYQRVSVEYTWEYSWFNEKMKHRPVPPDTGSWSWSGTINMLPEKPVIAGSHLDGQHVVLLVLTARIDE